MERKQQNQDDDDDDDDNELVTEAWLAVTESMLDDENICYMKWRWNNPCTNPGTVLQTTWTSQAKDGPVVVHYVRACESCEEKTKSYVILLDSLTHAKALHTQVGRWSIETQR